MKHAQGLERIGYRFFIGLRPGVQLGEEDRRLLEMLQPAGIVVFRKNFVHGEALDSVVRQFALLLRDVRKAIGREEVLVAIDHEGGRVFRLPAPFTNFGAARKWGPRADEVGAAYGVELGSLGINVNFAPVLDINSNPSNPVIGDRAFGSSVGEVTEYGLRFMAAQTNHGVLCCAKHFPGHGDADTDSHYALPVIKASADTLAERELVPFREAIARGIPLVMSAHLSVPALDSARPTTTSAEIGRRLLRKSFGFTGAYITDDLGMHAVQPLLDDEAFAVDVARAGHDLYMMCSEWTSTERMIDFARNLDTAIRKGSIDAADWKKAGERVRALVAKAHHSDPHPVESDVLKRHARLAESIARSSVAST